MSRFPHRLLIALVLLFLMFPFGRRIPVSLHTRQDISAYEYLIRLTALKSELLRFWVAGVLA